MTEPQLYAIRRFAISLRAAVQSSPLAGGGSEAAAACGITCADTRPWLLVLAGAFVIRHT